MHAASVQWRWQRLLVEKYESRHFYLLALAVSCSKSIPLVLLTQTCIRIPLCAIHQTKM